MITLPWSRLHTFKWIAGIGIAAAAGLVIGRFEILGAAAVVIGLVAIVVFLFPETAFIASLLSIIVGQFVRLPILGSENSVIINDLLLPIVIVVWLLRRLASRTWQWPRSSLTLPVWIFFTLLGLSLVWNFSNYQSGEILSGALYGLRWIEYAAVLVLGFDFVRTRQRAKKYLILMIWVGVVVALLGFFQLRLFPNFSFMTPAGWDPHIGRLLSTWFDPNFLAGWMALLVTICLSIALSKPLVNARWWWVALAVMTIAIVFTFSRSGYVALAVGTGLVTLVRARAVFFLGVVAFSAVVLFVPRVNERVVGIRTIDETAQLRLVSWGNAWTVISDHPWTGVGYNLYQYVQVKYGFLDDTREHSASGSDSSFLTVWATTGIFGVLVFGWLFVAMLREAWRTWRDRQLPKEWQGFGLGLVAGLIGLFFHSQFVNSLLYPHIMQTVWLFLAMAIKVRQPQPE